MWRNMYKKDDQSTVVDARFEPDGRIRVRRFTWDRAWVTVTAVGRNWMAEDGRHVLVMGAGDRTFELLLRRSDLTWRIVKVPPREAMA